jgi:hypothetical protein
LRQVSARIVTKRQAERPEGQPVRPLILPECLRAVGPPKKSATIVSEVAELALVEPLQNLLEGLRVDTYVALEGVVQGGHTKQ